MIKYLSRKFLTTMATLFFAFVLALYAIYKGEEYLMGAAAIIGAIAGIAAQYTVGNALTKGKDYAEKD